MLLMDRSCELLGKYSRLSWRGLEVKLDRNTNVNGKKPDFWGTIVAGVLAWKQLLDGKLFAGVWIEIASLRW